MSKNKSEINLQIDQDQQGKRLDLVISQSLEAQRLSLSRSQIKQLIDSKFVTVNSKPVKASLSLKIGDTVSIKLPEKEDTLSAQYDFNLNVCFEDQDLIVINKPAGLTVHPGANTGTKTLQNALISHYKSSSKKLPEVFDSVANSRGGIVHRLDKDTSGLIVVAKSLLALQSLSKQFADRTIDRLYQALVFSTPRGNRLVSNKDKGIIDLPLGRDPKRRIAMAINGIGERAAITEWKVIQRFDYATLVELKLRTGRTHQIRVHMNAIGSPVIGDKVYGDFSGLPLSLQKLGAQFGRQALHAKSLGFVHPRSGKILSFDSEIPEDMKNIIEKFSQHKGRF